MTNEEAIEALETQKLLTNLANVTLQHERQVYASNISDRNKKIRTLESKLLLTPKGYPIAKESGIWADIQVIIVYLALGYFGTMLFWKIVS